MRLFPIETHDFKLSASSQESLDRLRRRTEISDRLVSKVTGQSFIGQVEGNRFRNIDAQSVFFQAAFQTEPGQAW